MAFGAVTQSRNTPLSTAANQLTVWRSIMSAKLHLLALPSHMQQGALCSSSVSLSFMNTTNMFPNTCLTMHCQNPEPVQSSEDALQDMLTLVRPGHVREKIAIFTTHGGDTCHSHTSPAHTGRMGHNIQRVRHSNHQKIQRLTGGEAPPFSSLLPQQPSSDEGEEPKVSVGKMVAFLERRASEPPIKPLLTLRRSSAFITLSRTPPTDVTETGLHGARVSAIVAQLEAEGGVTRRVVGRVLLAAVKCREPISCQLRVEPPVHAPPLLNHVDSQCLSTAPEEAEPLPGLLFLTHETPPPTDSSQSGKRRHCEQTVVSLSASSTDILCTSAPPHPVSTLGLLFRNEPHQLADIDTQSGKRRRCDQVLFAGSPSSPDFLEARCRVQALLERPSFLWLLPPHLLLLVLRLLPTRSLAALKCTCSYLRLLIEAYAVRPTDSLWVSDPRYHDDPCKQCKRRYTRGDVSLCLWHPKPYCQALPFGPGYWMCCRRSHRDAPGCNVGLHDNRWVPPFHSINSPHNRSTLE